MWALSHLRQNGHERIARLSSDRADLTGQVRNQACLPCVRPDQALGDEGNPPVTILFQAERCQA